MCCLVFYRRSGTSTSHSGMVMPCISKGQAHKPTRTNGHCLAHCAPHLSWGISLAGKTARQGKQWWTAQGDSMAMSSVPGLFNMFKLRVSMAMSSVPGLSLVELGSLCNSAALSDRPGRMKKTEVKIDDDDWPARWVINLVSLNQKLVEEGPEGGTMHRVRRSLISHE